MAISQIEIDGNAAREKVKARWPNATSVFVGADSADVYDRDSGAVLGHAENVDFVVEVAWVDAATKMEQPA